MEDSPYYLIDLDRTFKERVTPVKFEKLRIAKYFANRILFPLYSLLNREIDFSLEGEIYKLFNKFLPSDCDYCVFLIESSNEKAIEAAIKIINGVFDLGSDKLKKDALGFSGVVYALIKSNNQKGIDAAITIIKGVFAGTNEELKKEALGSYGVVYKLIESKNEKAINAATEIIKGVFDGTNEELKKMAKYLKKQLEEKTKK